MGDTEWLKCLEAGRVVCVTVRGVVAVAVAETLNSLLRGCPDRDVPGVQTALQRHMCETIRLGRELPKYDEADLLLRSPETAPLLGSRLLLGLLRRVREEVDQPELTRIVDQGVPVTEGTLVAAAPALDRAGAVHAARELVDLLIDNAATTAPSRGGKDVSLLLHGSGRAYRVTPLTQRDMVRTVIPPDGTPIANKDIREAVKEQFGDAAPTDNQIDQTIVGLRRDKELRRVSHGVQAATELFGHEPYPTDPGRKRARS
ncbi:MULTISPECIES: hypothetical protein [Dermacoccus]|uniref:hypothetical protein n=1 Tax=Dermacoccus TaxID=57495 RepID=UPI0011125A4C|nr:hypothetical protein [Dermacoccus sp. Ellin185]